MSDTESTSEHRIENAHLVGREYNVKLAFTVEYEFPVIAGLVESDAVTEAELLAQHSDLEKTEPKDRDLVHSDIEKLRPIYEDDVEAGQLDFYDAPTAPSEDTFWDDSQHFENQV